MAVSATNLTANKSDVSASSFTTASISPTTNHLILLSVSARRGDSINPTVPAITGNGLTWVQVGTDVQFDTAGTSRKTFFLFRALGTASTGTITIDFGVQTITNADWIVDDIAGMDTTGTNGSGAIVQSATNSDQTGSATSLTVTLAAFSDVNNATYGTFSNDGPSTWTVGAGFTSLGAPVGASMDNLTEFKATNDTTVDGTFTNVAGMNIGGIAVEIKIAAAVGGAVNQTFKTLLGVGNI